MNVVRRAQVTQSLCIIDIGHEKTCVNIYRNGQFAMGKHIDLGGKVFDETIARESGLDAYTARNRKETCAPEILQEPFDALAMEIMKAMTFYSYTEGAESVMDLYLCGGSANLESLRQAIVKATDMAPHHISKLLMVDREQAAGALRCGLAAGAALQKAKGA